MNPAVRTARNAPTPLSCSGDGGCRYFPVQRGGRFSTKARTPSRKSALP